MNTIFYNANLIINNQLLKNASFTLNNNNQILILDNVNQSQKNKHNLNGAVVMPALSNMFVNVNKNFNEVINACISNGVTNCVFNGVLNHHYLKLANKTLGVFGVIINVNKLDEITNVSLLNEYNKILPYGLPIIYIDNILNLTEFEIEKIYLFAKNNNANLMVLANENLEQVGICHSETKQTPIELIESYGLFDLKLTLLKCQSVDKYDLEILKKYNANVVLTPIKDLLLGDGITPVVSLLDSGLNLSLASLNYADNFLNVLRIVKLMQNGYLNNKNAVLTSDLIKMATNNNLFKNNGFIVIENNGDLDLDKFIVAENKKVRMVFVNGKQIL